MLSTGKKNRDQNQQSLEQQARFVSTLRVRIAACALMNKLASAGKIETLRGRILAALPTKPLRSLPEIARVPCTAARLRKRIADYLVFGVVGGLTDPSLIVDTLSRSATAAGDSMPSIAQAGRATALAIFGNRSEVSEAAAEFVTWALVGAVAASEATHARVRKVVVCISDKEHTA